ncbi:SURF1 family protein [Fulvimarina endophytica]|uniref:SURF1-like protein n=1 Tax=Fulvimarina endophytica TaxID=2293836 RepID=A0A371X507_9HYPH|nr:SURF1 family protein [Fulvimarina endophytica]RFC64300.1 SURF1 family protein [Fulvimarina endophytica]
MSAAGEEALAEARRPEPMGRVKFTIALVLCLVGIVILFGLGTWQAERLQWKTALIERIDARMGAAPVSLDKALADYAETGDVDYQPITIEGRFLNEGERFFFSTFDGQTGWNVYTPLLTPDRHIVFVNRGFVPYEARDPSTRPGSQPEGEVRIEGVARNAPTEKPGYFVPDNDPEKDTFFWRDLAAMSEGLSLGSEVELVPFFVDADRDPTSRQLPVGGQTIVSIPNNHLQYALTWYGIGCVLVVMTGLLVGRQVRALRGARGPRA